MRGEEGGEGREGLGLEMREEVVGWRWKV